MEPIQTFFMEKLADGLGRVVRWDGDKEIHIGDCTAAEFGEKFRGNIWMPYYRRTDTGEVTTFNDAPIGAMYFADPGQGHSVGPDGEALIVKVPNGPTGHGWYVDGMANNCTKKDDNVHRCWIRHGDPRECRVNVDKSGNTCAAGGGSIQTSGWHGHLRNGWLVEA